VTLNQQWLLNLGLRYDSYDASARTPAFTRIARPAMGWDRMHGRTRGGNFVFQSKQLLELSGRTGL